MVVEFKCFWNDMFGDDARRKRGLLSNTSSSSSSSATGIASPSPPRRRRKKCSVNIRTVLLFLMLGTAASVFLCWGIISTVLQWYVLAPMDQQYYTPTNALGHSRKKQYINEIIVDTRSSYAETRSLPKKYAEVGGRRNDGDAILPEHDDSLPAYTRDMASDAIRPAPWSCGSNDDDEYFTDHSDDTNGMNNSSETRSSSIGEERHVFSFVHVYKSAGSTIRTFFRQYSEICHKSWMLLVSCKDHRNVSPQSSISIRALEDGTGEETYWKGCVIKEVYIRPNDLVNDYSMLHVDSIDIYGGHFRIGIVTANDNETNFDSSDSSRLHYSADHLSSTRQESSPSPSSTVVVRHIVFLRNPMARFVSGILFQHQHSAQFDGTLDGAVQRIKKNVRGSRKKQEYWIRSLDYLLTKSQATYFAKTRKEMMGGNNITTRTLEEKMNSIADIESRTAIQNLVHYNVIVGMAEQMNQSMTILQHVLVPPTYRNIHYDMPATAASDAAGTTYSQVQYDEVDALFSVFGGSLPITQGEPRGEGIVVDDKEKKSSKEGIRRNSSGQEGVTTELVLEELVNDVTFLPIFTEYVKYEQRIHDFAFEMHEMQYREALKV